MEQNSKQKMMDTIVARMQMRSEGIPESVAERAINLQMAQEEADDAALSSGQLYKKEMMDVITRRLSGGSLSRRIANSARDILAQEVSSSYEDSVYQNYVDSLQMERENRMAEERDAQEKIRRKRQEEIKLREEERIQKVKSSAGYKLCKIFGGIKLDNDPKELEKECFKQEEEKLNAPAWIPPRPYWSK